MHIILTEKMSQAEFARLVGIDASRVTVLARDGVLPPAGTAGEWVLAYTAHLRAQAAGRAGELDLSQERAALARVHRQIAELKERELRGELVRAIEIERELAAKIIALREHLQSMADRLAALVAAEPDILACRRLIRSEVDQALVAFNRADGEVLS